MSTKKGAYSATQKQTKPANKIPNISVRIDRLVNYEGTNIKATASANIANAFAIHGIKICESSKGLFVSMPATSYQKDGQTHYKETFHAITKEAHDALNSAVLEAYEQRIHMEENQETDISEDASSVFGQSM